MQEDPKLYDYWPYQNRPKIEWPNGAKIAFWVAPNIEFYELNPPENPHRKPWPQAYPAVGGYSIRDYGNRVGHSRSRNHRALRRTRLGVFQSRSLQHTLYIRFV